MLESCCSQFFHFPISISCFIIPVYTYILQVSEKIHTRIITTLHYIHTKFVLNCVAWFGFIYTNSVSIMMKLTKRKQVYCILYTSKHVVVYMMIV